MNTLGTHRSYPAIVRGLTPAGLRETRRWPTPDSVVRVMVGVMIAAADEVEPYEREEASKMREVARFFDRQLTTGISGLSTGLGTAIGKALTGG